MSNIDNLTPTFQILPLALLHESTTNPRRTFDEVKLHELASSIRAHGLIQPITVRPHNDGYEIIAGARRYRAAQIAEQDEVPVCIKPLDDAAALEVQIIENAQRADVHPYEEAAGYKQLLALPGYDVRTLADKCGKSETHVYSRLSLLSLIPTVAEAFQQNKITASHAAQIARLPELHQSDALKACFRSDYQDAQQPHLLPVRNLVTWIASNVFIELSAAPFALDDDTFIAGIPSCLNCPKRSGYISQLFADVEGDKCLDGECYQSKIAAHVKAQVVKNPELIQIATDWRRNDEDEVLSFMSYNRLDRNNKDSEPKPCKDTHRAIIAFGEDAGTFTEVCTNKQCKVHGFRMPQLSNEEIVAQKQRAKEQKARIAKNKERRATLETIIAQIRTQPVNFTGEQFRMLLRLLVWSNTYDAFDEVATYYSECNIEQSGQRDERSTDEVLDSVITAASTDELPIILARLSLTPHVSLPYSETQVDWFAKAMELFPITASPEPAAKNVAQQKAANKATSTKKAATKKGAKPTAPKGK